MNVYDFDETVFTGDSEDHFFAYLEKKPGFRLVNWKYKCYNFLVNSKLMTKTKARQHQYAFLKRMENLEQTLEDYWDTQIKFMKPWYLKAKRDDDIIASATPEFLMVPIMKRLRLNFYSDSYVDNDLAVHAKHAFVVYGDDQIAEWNEYFKTHKKK